MDNKLTVRLRVKLRHSDLRRVYTRLTGKTLVQSHEVVHRRKILLLIPKTKNIYVITLFVLIL